MVKYSAEAIQEAVVKPFVASMRSIAAAALAVASVLAGHPAAGQSTRAGALRGRTNDRHMSAAARHFWLKPMIVAPP